VLSASIPGADHPALAPRFSRTRSGSLSLQSNKHYAPLHRCALVLAVSSVAVVNNVAPRITGITAYDPVTAEPTIKQYRYVLPLSVDFSATVQF
jgi:hypothetical protein